MHHGCVPDHEAFDAVVLAGGTASRSGGIDKAELIFQGDRLLDRVVRAVAGAQRVVIVGPPRHIRHQVRWTREEPPGGGPVAAIAAGLELVEAPFVVVVAVDQPLLEDGFIQRLVLVSDRVTAAVAIDPSSRVQPLLACYPTALLRDVLRSEDVGGRSMRSVLARIPHRMVPDEGRSRDCDTLSDIEELRIALSGGEREGLA